MDAQVKPELKYTTEPYQHQKEALETAWEMPGFAYFLEQGTGKSKIVVDETVNLIEREMINCVVVLAPNLVHANWKEQFEIHGPPNWNRWAIQVYKAQSGDVAKQRQEQHTRDILQSGRVLVFLMNIESLSHEYATDYLLRILRMCRRTYMCIDELHKIKTPGAKRTKAAIKLGEYCKYRRITTGTEAEEGIQNLYSQMKFLDWRIIGFRFFTPFRNTFCVMGGFEMRQIIRYQNQDLLAHKIAPYVYQKRKKDCLDLPEKLYINHRIEMTPEQSKLYDSLEEELLTEVEEGVVIDTTQVLARMMKLQEVLCGHIHYEGKVKHIPSNRAHYVSELVQEADKTVVFCRFVMDVELVVAQLKADGIEFIAITGETNDRLDKINSWRGSPNLRALVMTTATGGTGLTLNEAHNTIFYSNSFNSTDRLQAEDRNHRIGQSEKVTYHDLTVKGKIDSIILKALRTKVNLATKFREAVDMKQLKEMLSEDEC